MSLAIISPRLPEQAKQNLEKHGFALCETDGNGPADPRIADHPDINFFITADAAFSHRGISERLRNSINSKLPLTLCDARISPVYPGDCLFNIAFTGVYAVCLKKTIPQEISAYFEKNNIILTNVPQGYARCSVIPIDKNTIATEDNGITRRAENAGIRVIPLSPGLIPLKGFSRGFAGGAFGRTDSRLFSTGIIPDDKSYKTLKDECKKRNIEIIELCENPAEDFGSILFA